MHHEHLLKSDKFCSLNQPAEHVEHLISSNSQEGGAHPLNICRVYSCEPNQELCFSNHLVRPLLFVEICSEGVSYCMRSNLVSVSVQILDLERKQLEYRFWTQIDNSQCTDSGPRNRQQLVYRFWTQTDNSQRTDSGPRERTVSVQILDLDI